MITRARARTPTGPPPRAPEDAGSYDSVGAWLDLLSSMLRLPVATRQSIHDELSEHLRQRTRELVLGGAREADAIQQAIEELGEAAVLARRLERAHRSTRRRLIMNASLFAVGAAVTAVAAVSLSARAPSPSDLSVFQPREVSKTPSAAVDEIRFSLSTETTIEEFVTDLRETHELGVSVDFGAIDNLGLDSGEPLGINAADLSLIQVLNLIADRGEMHDRLAWRFRDGIIELNAQSFFDRREVLLASYELDSVLSNIVGQEDVTRLLFAFVSPDDWTQNGGDLATLQIVGSTLFVEAPPRMHERTTWILDELRMSDERRSSAAWPPGAVTPVGPSATGRAGFGASGAGGRGGAAGLGAGSGRNGHPGGSGGGAMGGAGGRGGAAGRGSGGGLGLGGSPGARGGRGGGASGGGGGQGGAGGGGSAGTNDRDLR